jgi:hypothetical protein
MKTAFFVSKAVFFMLFFTKPANHDDCLRMCTNFVYLHQNQTGVSSAFWACGSLKQHPGQPLLEALCARTHEVIDEFKPQVIWSIALLKALCSVACTFLKTISP